MGLSDAFKRLLGKSGAQSDGSATFTASKTFTHQRVVRDGVEVTDPAELEALAAKITALNDASAASATTRHWGPLTTVKSETTLIVDGPEDLGDPAVREALEDVVEELQDKGLGEAASGIAEMLAQAEAGQQPKAGPVEPALRPPDTAVPSGGAAPSAPTPPTPPDRA